MATFNIYSITDSAISVMVSEITSGESVEFFLRLASETTAYTGFPKTFTADSTAMFKTFSNLPANTAFVLNVKTSSFGWIGVQSFSTDPAPTPTKPSKWYWTTAELNAFNGAGAFSTLTASRWNAFIDKINEVCVYANSSWTSTYTTLAGAKASAGGVLTATKFNSVKFNIGSRVPTGISDVSTGQAVLGSYFITLTNSLNAWIDTL